MEAFEAGISEGAAGVSSQANQAILAATILRSDGQVLQKMSGGRAFMKGSIVWFPETRVAVAEHRCPPASGYATSQRLIEWRRRQGLPPRAHRTYGVHYSIRRRPHLRTIGSIFASPTMIRCCPTLRVSSARSFPPADVPSPDTSVRANASPWRNTFMGNGCRTAESAWALFPSSFIA